MMVSGQVAIVTGAAQGIGLSTTRLLLQGGAKVTLIDIVEETLTSTSDDLKKEFGSDNVFSFQCDVTDKERFAQAFAQTKEHFGRIDILVNNAGVASIDDWEKLLQINLHAPIFGTMTALEYMSTQKGGKGGVIVNLSSYSAFYPYPGEGVYTASKIGLLGFTRSMKILQPTAGVRINCICPAIVDTPLSRRTMEKDKKVAELTMKLVEKQGGFIAADFVGEGILKLITDTSLNGKVMKVTPRRGHHFEEYSYDQTA